MLFEMREGNRRKRPECCQKVSIVTASYNQGRFIEETILSVKNKDYPHIEHSIVDEQSRCKSNEYRTF